MVALHLGRGHRAAHLRPLQADQLDRPVRSPDGQEALVWTSVATSPPAIVRSYACRMRRVGGAWRVVRCADRPGG